MADRRLEIAVARAALGSPYNAAAAVDTGVFRDRLTTVVCPAVLVACLTFRDVIGEWENRDLLRKIARLSLTDAGAWCDDERHVQPVWTSPIWSPIEVREAIRAMSDAVQGTWDWEAALSAFEQPFKRAA